MFVEFGANKGIQLVLFVTGLGSIEERVHLPAVGVDVQKKSSLLPVVADLLL